MTASPVVESGRFASPRCRRPLHSLNLLGNTGKSHRRAVPSPLAVASRRPSGLNARPQTCPVYLPVDQAAEGARLAVEYLGEQYPVTVAVAGSTPLFDPANDRIRC